MGRVGPRATSPAVKSGADIMTAPDQMVARSLAEALVKDGLADRVNISAMGHSVYRWDGVGQDGVGKDGVGKDGVGQDGVAGLDAAIVSDPECFMIIKTTTDAIAALKARATELHPYDVPAFVVFDVDQTLSDQKFSDWITNSIF